MIQHLRCLIGLHRWRWYALYDHDIRKPFLSVSQCDNCRRISGGWRGPSDMQERAE